MSRGISARLAVCLVALTAALTCSLIGGRVFAQSNSPNQLTAQPPSQNPPVGQMLDKSGQCDLRQIPMVNTTPGAVAACTTVKNPAANDPQSVQRGIKYFISFNCVGCHAANGAGGMGPALSDPSFFKYGTDPSVLFLVVSHGAPNGMPAWGTVLPENVIWDLVNYIESINKAPDKSWGTTVSPGEHMPGIEQVPAEFKQTATPRAFTEPFSNGQKPTGANPTGPAGPTAHGAPQ
jgi:cytochrome c oxidase cbb3-type subunit III